MRYLQIEAQEGRGARDRPVQPLGDLGLVLPAPFALGAGFICVTVTHAWLKLGPLTLRRRPGRPFPADAMHAMMQLCAWGVG